MAKLNNSKNNIDRDRAEREQLLRELFKDADGAREIIDLLIGEVVFLEARLAELRELPQIKVNKEEPEKQKPTVAAKQYKELLQQYNNCIKTLCGVLRKDSGEEESPLRAFLRERA